MDGNNDGNKLCRHLSTESEDESKCKKQKKHYKEDNFYNVITSIQSLVAKIGENREVYSHNTAQSSVLYSTSILTNGVRQHLRQSYNPIPITLHPFSPTNFRHSNSLDFTSLITPCSFTQTQTISLSADSYTYNLPQNLSKSCNASVLTQLPFETNMTHSIQLQNFPYSKLRNHTQSSVHLISQSDIMNVSLECPNFYSNNNTEPSNNITNTLNINMLNKHYENMTQIRDINIFDDNKRITTRRYDMLLINDNLQNTIVNTQPDVQEMKQYIFRESLLNRKLMNLAQIVRPIRLCLPRCLPLQTVEDVYQFETIDDDQYREVVRYMQYLGGLTPSDAIFNAFKHAITDELSKHYTWYGAEEGLHAMYKTRIAKAIWEAVATNVNFVALTDTEFKYIMMECLQHAKQRLFTMLRTETTKDTNVCRTQIKK